MPSQTLLAPFTATRRAGRLTPVPSALGPLLAWLLVAALGALESIYGRTQYLGDWISYLNVSRAVSTLDWKAVFDPMWSPGYPALVAFARLWFPATPEGEWAAISALNWLIFLGAYAAWRRLIGAALTFFRPSAAALRDRPFLLWTGVCVFLSCTLALDRVSSACPDLLVTTLFLWSAGQLLSLLNRPRTTAALLLGLFLGLGLWVKGVFLSFEASFLLAVALCCWRKKLDWQKFAVTAFACLSLCLPLAIGLSRSYGQFTLGASGSLNYAFHVNQLPHWTNWQGGSALFGTPSHTTRPLVPGLPVFAFATPFRTTYPPYNNLAYWYRGSHGFFSLRLQILALARTLYLSTWIVRDHPFLEAQICAILLLLLKTGWRRSLLSAARRFWPVLLPALIGVVSYFLVHVEDRYLSPFCLVFGLLPVLPLLNPVLSSKRSLIALLLLIDTLGTVAELRTTDRATWKAALHREDYHRDPQWQIAAALPAFGLRPGDPVAVIRDASPGYRVHWAYVSGLRIVAEFGALPWTLDPWDRTRFDHPPAEPANTDFAAWFWQKLDTEGRTRVLDAFEKSGAKAVIALSVPGSPPEPGWRPIAKTHAWLHLKSVKSVSDTSIPNSPEIGKIGVRHLNSQFP